MSEPNPFAALLGLSTDDNKNNKSETGAPVPEVKRNDGNELELVLEQIFGFTLCEKHSKSRELLLLEDIQKSMSTNSLNLDILSHALFDRVFMCNGENEALQRCKKNNWSSSHATEDRPIVYLANAFNIMLENANKLEEVARNNVRDLILQNVSTIMIQPEIFETRSVHKEMLEVLMENPALEEFFIESSRRVLQEENHSTERLKIFIQEMVQILLKDVASSSLVTFNYNIFTVLYIFSSHEFIAELFLECCQPPVNKTTGFAYAETLLGSLFNTSVLPKSPASQFEYFTEPLNPASNSQMEGILWSNTEKINQEVHKLFLQLLKCSPKIKNIILTWIGNCLKSNVDRGKLWNAQAPPEMNPANFTSVTDGFMLNMCNVMLRLCQPFTSNFRDKKILKVDPTYCAVPNEKTKDKGIHMSNLSEETCFLPMEENGHRYLAENYNFVTECFFMTHKTLDLGFRVAVDKLMRQNHEMARMERAFNDALRQSGQNSDVMDSIKQRMSEELKKYLSLKCQLSDPIFLNLLFDFTSSTAFWFSQVAVHNDLNKNKQSYAPLDVLPIKFPLSNKIPNTLNCIPEFLVENIVSTLIFLRRFSLKVFEEQGFEKMDPILTFILIYMGSQNYLKNPHIRARLAEGLESLLPSNIDEQPGSPNISNFQRDKVFKEHSYKLQIVENLLNVFVGIEMTGQSVEFEQKFNYRRPMYCVIEYLWEIPEQRQCFKILAAEAEEHIEAVNPPLFLRFANLLINDAIFLLDEALANMAKIKEMEQAQDNGEWNQLSARERTQNISYMNHVGMLARFDNILGSYTIKTLEKLTSFISDVFTHSTMVDRIAAMLNYFLLNLVGPNKKNFKVKDSKEYSFHPASTVMDICKIYINLRDSDAFCLAVSQDGRSYSPTLFSLAEAVLVRIGGGTLIPELQEVATKVAQKAEEYKTSEEAISEAPDHYLDPIMSTLMTDPVILPSSKQTVDRTTIARHLLSDQTDPFNRSPLTMDQVIPNIELAKEINEWLANRKK